MRVSLATGVAISVVGFVSAIASATVVQVAASKDNTIYESTDPTFQRSNGIGAYMFVGESGNNGSRRALIGFDIAAAIPAGATINSVTLQLHMSRTVSGAQSIALQPVLRNWGEGESDAGEPGGAGTLSAPGDASWLYSQYDSTMWTTPGGDLAPSASSTKTVTGVGFYTWSTAAMAADVQSWLNNPSGNFGWCILGRENSGRSAKRFDTRENPEPTFRPRLTVDYTVPEPTSLVLLFIAGTVAARRRGT